MLDISSPLAVQPKPFPPEQLLIDCPVCCFKAYSAFQLRQHAILVHLSADASVHCKAGEPFRFQCEVLMCAFCGASSTDSSNMQEHVTRVHSDYLTNAPEACAILSQSVLLERIGGDASQSASDSEDEFKPLSSSSNFATKIHSDSSITSGLAEAIMQHSCPSVANDALTDKNLSSPLNTTISDSGITVSTMPATAVASTADTVGWRPTPPSCHRSERPLGARSTVSGTSQDWSKLIARSDKKFICLLCRRYIYSGRTEVVFHSVTRHLLSNEIEHNLSHYGRLTDSVKRQIGHNFAEGMRIRSGVHYKDAKRVEAALFRSIELHLRYMPTEVANDSGMDAAPRFLSCSGCGATFSEIQVAYAHVNDELRSFLPEFMRARSCPWSLSTREEWVWCVPDLPLEPLPGKSDKTFSKIEVVAESTPVSSNRVHKTEAPIQPRLSLQTYAENTTVSPSVSSDTAAAVEVVKSLVAAAGLLQTANLSSGDRVVGPLTSLSSPMKSEGSDNVDGFTPRVSGSNPI